MSAVIYVDVVTGTWGRAVDLRVLTPTEGQERRLAEGAADSEIIEIGETGSPVVGARE